MLGIRFVNDAAVRDVAGEVVISYRRGQVVSTLAQASMLRWVRTGDAEFVDLTETGALVKDDPAAAGSPAPARGAARGRKRPRTKD